MKSVTLFGGLELDTDLPSPDLPFEDITAPQRIILPLSDRPGVYCRPLVQKGEAVFAGEKIAEDPTGKMMPVHSSISGKVVDIRPYRYAEGGNTLSVFIETDGKDSFKTEVSPIENLTEADPATLIDTIKKAGVKIIPFEHLPEPERMGQKIAKVKHFVINAIGTGYSGALPRRILVKRANELSDAAQMIRRMFNPEKLFLVVNREHTDVQEAITHANLDSVMEVLSMDVYYPLGHPHLLFKAIFGKEIPCPGGKAIDFGVVFSSVDTVLHALEAVTQGKPLIKRYVSVFGSGIKSPKNLRVRIGTPLKELVEACGGFDGTPGRIVLGNPLDGMAQFDLDRPVLRDTRLLWVQQEADVMKYSYRACINCGDCTKVCPVGLMPNFLSKFCEFGKFEEAAEQYDLWTCIDCGLCAYVCPAKRPIVHFINYGKRELSLRESEYGTL
ncbi:MAG TPA: RnfABCDGE type electron transport complex subunit C [Desulfobacterales bacterium]|nr:RnfABCDGE type electron transport complex subunit C [Desulfobacterales bacterium]